MAVLVLEVRNLKRNYVSSGGFLRPAKVAHAVKGVNFTLEKGKTPAVVGGERLRQINPSPHDHADRSGHLGRDPDRW